METDHQFRNKVSPGSQVIFMTGAGFLVQNDIRTLIGVDSIPIAIVLIRNEILGLWEALERTSNMISE